MADPLTGPRALELVREVVGADPDYTYDPPGEGGECLYVVDDPLGGGPEPSCLVGRVLVRAGWDPESLIVRVAMADGDGRPTGTFGPDEMDAAAYAILARAQQIQDRCLPWRQALAAAEGIAAELGVTSGASR